MLGFEAFCGGPLFASSKSGNVTSFEITQCFRLTIIYWVPMAAYLILFPFWIRMLIHRKIQPQHLKPSPLYYFKMIMTFLLVVMTISFLIMGGIESSRDIYIPPAFHVLWILLFTILLSIMYIIKLERVHGKYSSMLLFLFFLVLTIVSITNVSALQSWEQSKAIKTMFVLFVAACLVELIAFLMTEHQDYQYLATGRQKICPESYVGVLSNLYFFFMTGLVYKGYKRPLELTDLWELNSEEKSANLAERLENRWNALIKKSGGVTFKYEEQTPSHIMIDTDKIEFKSRRKSKIIKYLKYKPSHRPSLWIALLQAFHGKLLASTFLKIIYDLLQFCPPLILRLILAFLNRPNDPISIGLFYCALMFVNMTVQSCILHQYFKRMMLIGQRFRTSLNVLIYNKSLRLSSASRQQSTVGEMVNLMSVDSQRLMDLASYMQIVWSGPLQIILAIALLWNTLGPSILAGVAMLLVAIPVNTWIGARLKKLQGEHMKLKDIRIKEMNEILNGMKVIKLYAWEESFVESITATRKKELKVLRKTAILQAVVSLIWTITPFLVSVVTFAVYVKSSQSNILTAEKAFVSLTLFGLLRFPLFMLANVLTSFAQAKVSIKRLEDFFLLEELDPSAVERKHMDENAIEVQNGSFQWKEYEFKLHGINFKVPKKSLVAIVGDVGSGKSALIQSILGEMEKTSGSVYIDGSIAYVPQQAWILNASVRDNIIMLRPYNETLYNKVIAACALESDLAILPAGDKTEIGERGINLSGGQKQRISLARAIYSNADIYLMDDPLSAVDSHVAKHIFMNAVGPTGLLGKKTRVLVTNSLGFLPKCNSVIYLRKGTIAEQGSFDELISLDGGFSNLARQHLNDLSGAHYDDDEAEDVVDFLNQLTEDQKHQLHADNVQQLMEIVEKSKKKKAKMHIRRIASSAYKRFLNRKKPEKEKSADTTETALKGKLTTIEHIEKGKMKKRIALSYFKCYGRISMILLLISFTLSIVSNIGSSLWLSDWSNNAEKEQNDTKARDTRIGVYAALGFTYGMLFFICQVCMLYGAYRASVKLHSSLLNRLVRGTMMFFDTTPIGRIINRISKDIDSVDYSLPSSLRSATGNFISIITTTIIIVITNPIFLAVAGPIAVLFYFLQRFYIASSRQLRRLESVTKSPIYSHFGESLQGLQSIRACQISEGFIHKNNKLNDISNTAYYPSILVNRWLAMILETLANIIVFSTCLLGVTARSRVSAGLAGLAISNALSITQALNWVVRMISEIETNVVSVERVIEYCEIDTEPPWIVEDRRPPKNWPDQGEIKVQAYSLRYRENLDPALIDINMNIRSGEKIGLVGRTGAGKSSLTVGLFRLVESTTGQIVIDDIPIKEIGLHDLRKRLTVLPQDPVIFSGSVRTNLDPFNEYQDNQIWEALKNASLDGFVSSLNGKLDYEVTESGENLSVGQKQLFCLARALLRKTKILILDEATAAVDVETDELIQSTIRTQFKDCTVISIAHRINTILDYDRIAVFDNGRLVEFDAPRTLIAKPDSVFASLVRDANIRVSSDKQEAIEE